MIHRAAEKRAVITGTPAGENSREEASQHWNKRGEMQRRGMNAI